MRPQETWRVFHVSDPRQFVEHLDLLFSEGAVLSLEGCIAPDVQSFLRSAGSTEVPKGRGCLFNPFLPFIAERPPVSDFLMPLTRANLVQLAKMMEHHAEPEICEHLHVYEGGDRLFEGHDWPGDQMYLTGETPEEKVRAFCQAAGCRYEWSRDLVVDQ